MEESKNVPLESWLSALRNSHQRLSGLAASLSADELAGPSYDDEWSIAQVLSHLGSGAEIFALVLRAGVDGKPAPGADVFQPLWDRWNAKPPQQQVEDALKADADLLAHLDRLDDGERQSWHLTMYGGDQNLGDLVRMRLGEHAVHTWDVAVACDPAATLSPDATELLVDTLDRVVRRAGKAPEQPLSVHVDTERPSRHFLLHANSNGAQLERLESPTPTGDDPVLGVSAEGLIRLVYGRLDPDHTPPLHADGTDLNVLRSVFPGF